MPVIFNPHRDRREPLFELARNAGVLLGLMGWFTIALGLSMTAVPTLVAVPGGLAAVTQPRFFRATGVVEVVVLALILSLAPSGGREWIWTGAATSAIGRIIAMVARARFPVDG